MLDIRSELKEIRRMESRINSNSSSYEHAMLAFLKNKYRKHLRIEYSENNGVCIMDDSVTYPKWKQIRTIEFNGSKDDLLRKLNRENTYKTGSNCDCTGDVILLGITVAHMRDNLFKVCESFELDV